MIDLTEEELSVLEGFEIEKDYPHEMGSVEAVWWRIEKSNAHGDAMGRLLAEISRRRGGKHP